MDTATAIAPEPQCQHLSRTDVGGKAGRQVCDVCRQIFQDGIPAEKIGQELSDLTPEAATEAAIARVKKARKPKTGKAEFAGIRAQLRRLQI